MFKTLNGTVLVVPGREKHTEKGGGEATSLNALNRLPCTCHVVTIHVYTTVHDMYTRGTCYVLLSV